MKEWDEIKPVKVLIIVLLVGILVSLFSGCTGTYYVVDNNPLEREHPTGIYYYDDLPYWGLYNNYYYYYGVPHVSPWWFYYTLMPNYVYNTHTHVHVHCNNGYYVSKPRGPKFNNGSGRTYKPNKTNIRNNTRVNITPTNTTKVKTNSDYRRPVIKTNTNRSNTNRSNTNRSNTKVIINKSNNNRSNIKKTNKRPR